MSNSQAEWLTFERKRLKLTRKALADRLSVADKTIQRWEADTPIPSDKLSMMINLGFDVQYVLTGQRSNSALSSDEAFMLEKIRQADTGTRNKILMLLLGSQEIPTSGVSNQDNVVNGQQVGSNNEQTNNFNNDSSADQNIQGDVKIKSKGKRSQAAFNISNNDK